MTIRRLGPTLLLLAAACSSHRDRGSTVTADEARQLNEAAAALDANRLDANDADPDDNESDAR